MSNDPEKLLTLAEAAKFAGVSTRTIQRWITDQKIRDRRQVSDKAIPIVINERELIAYLATTKRHDIGHVKGHDTTPNQYFDRLIETITKERDRILEDRNRLVHESERDRDEMRRLRERIDALNERVASLEREIHSLGGSGRGILGYLSKGLQRFVKS